MASNSKTREQLLQKFQENIPSEKTYLKIKERYASGGKTNVRAIKSEEKLIQYWIIAINLGSKEHEMFLSRMLDLEFITRKECETIENERPYFFSNLNIRRIYDNESYSVPLGFSVRKIKAINREDNEILFSNGDIFKAEEIPETISHFKFEDGVSKINGYAGGIGSIDLTSGNVPIETALKTNNLYVQVKIKSKVENGELIQVIDDICGIITGVGYFVVRHPGLKNTSWIRIYNTSYGREVEMSEFKKIDEESKDLFRRSGVYFIDKYRLNDSYSRELQIEVGNVFAKFLSSYGGGNINAEDVVKTFGKIR